jgi:hypothetical protein
MGCYEDLSVTSAPFGHITVKFCFGFRPKWSLKILVKQKVRQFNRCALPNLKIGYLIPRRYVMVMLLGLITVSTYITRNCLTVTAPFFTNKRASNVTVESKDSKVCVNLRRERTNSQFDVRYLEANIFVLSRRFCRIVTSKGTTGT